MEFGGRYIVAAPRLAVWEALNDTAVLKACIPGCRRIDWVDAASLEAEIGVNLGVVKPVFTGDLVLSNVVPAQSYTLTGRGRGGVLGMAEASADIVLSDIGADPVGRAGETRLVFVATGGASGRIMQLGKKLVGNSAQRVIDGFFERFGEAMGAEVTPLPPETESGPSAS
ncbi:CoxG family protein [Pelagibacterium halotolerans]|uniref:CoxG family protein n=1 Tax=Pelagibacterium halotolerans TaxID=531813 RepID=UPI00384A6CA6